MNFCVLSGEIINEIDLKFVYDIKNKRISRKNISIIIMKIKTNYEQVTKAYAYDEIADWIYRNVKQGDKIVVIGRLTSERIEVRECEMI